MKNNSKIRFDFSEMNWQNIVHFGMHMSSFFFVCIFVLVPPITKIAFDAAVLDLQTKGVSAMSPGLGRIALRDSAWHVVNNMLRQMANFTEMEYQGDGAKYALTGFSVYVPNPNSGPTLFSVKQGAFSGQIVSEWPRDVNNHGYVLTYSINEDGQREVFTDENAGKTICTVNGLTPGKEYIFTYSVVYTDGRGAKSDPIIMMVT